MNTDDTIVAIATPAGRGGLGVVRLSGTESARIAAQVLRPRGAHQELTLTPWRVRMAELPDKQGALIDRVLVGYFRAPHSYTGEDIVEISCHGAPVVLRFLVEQCLAAGARLAEPGEFTLRAFLSGRMDLTQAEAVRDLIDAQTLYQAQVATQQMEGAVSHWLAPLKQRLVDLIALLEAGTDFAEDDVSVPATDEIRRRLEALERGLRSLADGFRTGKIIHQGLTLAIVGRPNVGKSSLFNCMLEQDRAIVTASPGTTRDLVAETVEIGGIPLRFVDTAGVRHAFNEAESIGVRKSLEAAADSDLALLVFDGAAEFAAEDRDLLQRLYPVGKLLLVVNKCDQPLRLSQSALEAEMGRLRGETGNGRRSTPIRFVSALEHKGIEDLRQAILQAAAPALSGSRETQWLTNVRHERLVCEALDSLGAARRALTENLPHEMLLLDLYNALRPLDAITGQTTVEDILTQIFSTFCIGK
jgi:tRNA modification GTPase